MVFTAKNLTAALGILLVASVAPASINLVANPDFGTVTVNKKGVTKISPSLDSWTAVYGTTNIAAVDLTSSTYNYPDPQASPINTAVAFKAGTTPTTVQQAIAGLSPSDQYQLTFDLALVDSSKPNKDQFAVIWDGTSLSGGDPELVGASGVLGPPLPITPTASGNTLVPSPDFSWTTYTFSLNASGDDLLAFAGQDQSDSFLLTNVDLVDEGPITADDDPPSLPEPSTLVIWSLFGLASLLGTRVGRRRGGQFDIGSGGRRSWSAANRAAILDAVKLRGRQSGL